MSKYKKGLSKIQRQLRRKCIEQLHNDPALHFLIGEGETCTFTLVFRDGTTFKERTTLGVKQI